jgi:hypothetical protein
VPFSFDVCIGRGRRLVFRVATTGGFFLSSYKGRLFSDDTRKKSEKSSETSILIPEGLVGVQIAGENQPCSGRDRDAICVRATSYHNFI